MTNAYARVSARDQNLTRQLNAFRTFGVPDSNIFLDMPLLDTRAKSETPVGKFISDIVLQVLSFVAENERANIRARQAEGIRLAKERGVRFGRPRRQYSQEFLAVAQDYMQKRIPLREALEKTNMRVENFYYHIRILRNRLRETYPRQ